MSELELHCWPSATQTLMLKASLLAGERAASALSRWEAATNLDSLDMASQRLAPLLYRNATRAGLSHSRMPLLKGTHRYWWFRNTARLRTLAKALAGLDDQAGRIMLLKGAAVASRYYQDLGERPMNDIDVLVEPACARQVIRHLLASGYAPFHPIEGEGEAAREAWIDETVTTLHAINLIGEDGREIDVHWRAFHEDTPERDQTLWERARPIDFFGTRAFVPSAEDLFLQIVAHGLRQNVLPAIWWVADVTFILRDEGGGFDWQHVALEAESRQLTFLVRRALRYLGRNIEVDVASGQRALGRTRVSAAEIVQYWERCHARDEMVRFRAYRILRDYQRQARARGDGLDPLSLVRFVRGRWQVDTPQPPAELARRFVRVVRRLPEPPAS